MIHAREFVEAARAHGFEWYAGVPCSFLTPFINYVIDDPALKYVSAANEGDAVALAAGATIGGKRAVAMMQNSGLGNAVSPLTSLTYTFQIPLLVICTHRGAPGVNDEPQHELMGHDHRAPCSKPWRCRGRSSRVNRPPISASAPTCRSVFRSQARALRTGHAQGHLRTVSR